MEECPMTFTNTYITKLAGAFFARSKVLLATAGILLLSLLVACASTDDDNGGGGSADTYTVGGTVAGHTGKVSLTLTYGDDDKTETLEVEAGTDKFTFAAKLEDSQSFTLAVTAPVGQACSSSLAQGTIAGANVTNIEVTCGVATYSVGGTVSGLADGDTITLTLTPTGGTAETEEVTGNGDFSFDTKLANGNTYTVTTSSPDGKACTVAPRGTLTMGDADADITVTCVPTYSVSGTVNRAADNSQITITLLHADPPAFNPVNIAVINVTPSPDGKYTITGIPENKIYLVTVASATANEVCTPNITIFSVPITVDQANSQITCSTAAANTYSVGGNISGLESGDIITLTLSPTSGTVENKVIIGDADVSIADNFTFDTKIAANTTFTVAITTQPAGRNCSVDNTGTLTMGTTDVTDIAVTCTASYSISGSVTGAVDNRGVFAVLTLYDDDAGTDATRQTVSIDADGIFSFTDIPENKYYILQASSIATGEICSGPSTTPTLITADITDARITCTASAAPYLRIELSSDNNEASLTTVNVFIGDAAITDTSDPTTATRVIRGADADVVILSNGLYFPFEGFFYHININDGQYYALTVTTTSSNETCTIEQNASGGPITDNVTAIVTCQ